MTLSFPQADLTIEYLTGRVHEFIGTDYRDAAIDAASRAEAAADRLGSAEKLEGWVSSAEAYADAASGAADAATSAVRVEVEKLTAGAPEAFDTLKEIADELDKNETERAALANSIGEKARREEVDAALGSKSDVGHGHEVDDVNGLDTALGGAGKTAEWGQVSGKPSTFPPVGHRHTTGQIDGLDALIDQRARTLIEANGPRIERVTALPTKPDPNTLYVVVEP